MADDDKTNALLAQIEENQRKALEVQQKHLALAQALLDRSNQTIQESIELQRTAVARQRQIMRVVMPLIGVLVLLLVYLVVKWRVL